MVISFTNVLVKSREIVEHVREIKRNSRGKETRCLFYSLTIDIVV